MMRMSILIACAVTCLLSACASSLVSSERGENDESDALASAAAQPGSKYCEAFEALLNAQPEGAMFDDELGVAMGAYADAVERVAAMSLEDEAVVLWELAAVARLVAENPGDNEATKRMGQMFVPVAPISIRAMNSCEIEF